MTNESDARRDKRWTTAVSIVSAAAVIRLAFAAVLPVFPDEAYYWEWSRRLAAGYFDHPPAVALLIRFGTTFLGATPLGIRLGSITAGWIASLFTIMIARRLAGGDASIAIRAAIIMSVHATCRRGTRARDARRAAPRGHRGDALLCPARRRGGA